MQACNAVLSHFGSACGLSYMPRHLRASTRNSKCARRCHCSVNASLSQGGHGILTVRPSDSPLGLSLGPDSPRDDWHRPGNLSRTAGGGLALLIVTHAYICFSMRSRKGHPSHSTRMQCSPTEPHNTCGSRAFGVCLIPDYYPCGDPRPVSCYALFE